MKRQRGVRVRLVAWYLLAGLVVLGLVFNFPKTASASLILNNNVISLNNTSDFVTPYRIAVDTTANRYYVGLSDRVVVIDIATSQVITSIVRPLPPNYFYRFTDLAVNPVTKRLYVNRKSNFFPTLGVLNNIIDVYDTTTFNQITGKGAGSISGESFENRIVINPNTNTLYYKTIPSDLYGADPKTITIADGDLNVKATLSAPNNPTQEEYSDLLLNPVTNRLYAVVTAANGGSTSSYIRVFNTETNSFITNITNLGTANFSRLAINPITNRIYVVNGAVGYQYTNTATINTPQVFAIDGNTNTVLNTINLPQYRLPARIYNVELLAIAVNTLNNRIYIGQPNNYLTEIDGTTNTTIGSQLMPFATGVIATVPNTNRLLVATSKELYSLDDGGQPTSLTISSATNQTAQIGTTFITPLEVTVKNAQGQPIWGVPVTFSAPSSGASGTFVGGNTAISDIQGKARIFVVANNSPGTYNVTANVSPAVATPVTFNLTNTTTPLGTFSLLPATIRLATTLDNSRPPLTASGVVPNPNDSSSVMLGVAGTNGIPINATGIVGTLTNVSCTGGGNLRFWTGTTVPNAVNLNVPGASPNLNLTTSFAAPLDSQGKVYLGLASGVNISCGYAVDVTGYYIASTPTASNVSLLPATVRLATTLDNSRPPLTATGVVPKPNDSSSSLIQATGTNGIPANATGIMGTLTNVSCTGGGNLRFWTGTTVPNAVNLNIPGANSALNLTASFTAPLDSQGRVYLGLASGENVSCGYAVDVTGYVSPAGTGSNIGLLPVTVRLATTLDHSNRELFSGYPHPNPDDDTSVLMQATLKTNIPANASGLTGTLTNVGCNGGAYLVLWAGQTVPANANNLNIPGANPALNLTTSFITALDNNGSLYLGLGSRPMISCGYAVDVTGYIVK